MKRRFLLIYVAPVLFVMLASVWSLVTGRDTLYLRDVANAHTQAKLAQASLLRTGSLPLVDPFRDGQPLVGNPNTVALYPDNLLYVLAPTRWALGAHVWLHWLLAPFAMFALARVCGLRRPAAWAAGTVYATSGFALSHFNLYNSVAALALTPALVAATLCALRCREQHRTRRAAALVATFLALLLLGGDPPTAALAVVLAASAAVAFGWRPKSRRAAPVGRRRLLTLGVATVLGVLLAAPQLIELGRITGTSFRGAREASSRAILAQSLDPRATTEWLLPLFFGRPDRQFWGQAFFGDNEPFYLSLFPGALALALMLAAGRPRTRAGWWAWGTVGAAVFVALGAFNPLIRWLVDTIGSGGLRYPIKAWLWGAIGVSLLAGMGFDRLRPGPGRRRLLIVLGGVCLGYVAIWQLLARTPAPLGRWLESLSPERLRGAVLVAEQTRWSALAFLIVALLGTAWLAVFLGRRWPAGIGAVVLVLHSGSQLFFLAPLLDRDASAFYQQQPDLLRFVPDEPWVVHGRTGNLFGPPPPVRADDPDARTVWEERRRFATLAPQAGVGWGRRYAFDSSPEGLDTLWSVAMEQAVHGLGDLDRLRLLEAFGVATLILDRPLEPAAAERTGLHTRSNVAGRPTWVYKLGHASPPVALAEKVHYAADANAILGLLRELSFDAQKDVVLIGDLETAVRKPGRMDLVTDDAERVVADIDSSEGTVLVVQRAWLPIYRASIDGAPARVLTANLARMAVEVPAGLHRVRIWVDRRPFYAGLALAMIALVGVVVLGRSGNATAAKATDCSPAPRAR